MKRSAHFLLFVATVLMFAHFASAQDDSERAPITLGDFNLSGSATSGFRFDDIKGYEPQFREVRSRERLPVA